MGIVKATAQDAGCIFSMMIPMSRVCGNLASQKQVTGRSDVVTSMPRAQAVVVTWRKE